MVVKQVEFSRTEYELNRKPCVYEVLDLRGKPLYVGKGEKGFARVFSQQDKHETRVQAFAFMERVRVTFFDTVEEMTETEDRLIHESHPPFNGGCGKCEFYVERLAVKRAANSKSAVNTGMYAQKFLEHYTTAQKLVEEQGGIPGNKWLRTHGYAPLDQYMRLHPNEFKPLTRVKITKHSKIFTVRDAEGNVTDVQYTLSTPDDEKRRKADRLRQQDWRARMRFRNAF